MAKGDFAKRAVSAIYSRAANRLYEPVVVRFAFPLFGGNLNELVIEQGRRAVASADGAPILDMPVGTAFFTVAMARRSRGIVVGADIATGMVVRARRTAREAGTINLVAVQADAHRLPFGDDSFGAILCTNGLQVIPGLEPTLSELHRVLRPEAKIFVSVVTLPIGAALPARTAERLPTVIKSKRELLRAMEDAGFRSISTRRNRLGLLIEAVKSGPRTRSRARSV